uniref:Uncharacterized protein n=1 Tax=Anopheles coluzzii TaxID=1518534 RepID=A0A6E8W863_ANOCL
VLIRNTLISKMYFEENYELKTLLIVNSHLNEIPSSLKNLTSLNILTIRGSKISVVDLSLVSRMKMLTDLVIDVSKISSLASHSQAITQSVLKHIKLRHNLLKSINFDQLKPFGMLQTFDITHNSVNTSTGSVSNSQLQRLNLGDNDMAYFFFCGWTELSNVSYLAVPNNQLQHIPNCLATFPNIISLDFSFNRIRSVKMLTFTNSTDLTTLKLWYNQLTTFQFDLVKPFQKLHTLDIAHNVIRSVVGNLTNQSLRYFAIQHNLVSKLDFCSWNEIASLEWLSIGHNRLRYVPSCLTTFPNVTLLDLSFNWINHVQMHTFVGLNNLKDLYLGGNKL